MGTDSGASCRAVPLPGGGHRGQRGGADGGVREPMGIDQHLPVASAVSPRTRSFAA